MPDPIIHVEFLVSGDAEALKDFYADTFGWPKYPHPEEGFSLFRTDTAEDTTVDIGPVDNSDGDTPVTVWIEVDDVEAALATIVANGGQVVGVPRVIPGGPGIARFRDPEGNVIGISAKARAAFRAAVGD